MLHRIFSGIHHLKCLLIATIISHHKHSCNFSVTASYKGILSFKPFSQKSFPLGPRSCNTLRAGIWKWDFFPFFFFFPKHQMLLCRQYVSSKKCVPFSTSSLFVPRQSALNSSSSSRGKSCNVNSQEVRSVRSQLSPTNSDPGSLTRGCLQHLAQPADSIYHAASPARFLAPGSGFRNFHISGGCIFPPFSKELDFFLPENTLTCQRPRTFENISS